MIAKSIGSTSLGPSSYLTNLRASPFPPVAASSLGEVGQCSFFTPRHSHIKRKRRPYLHGVSFRSNNTFPRVLLEILPQFLGHQRWEVQFYTNPRQVGMGRAIMLALMAQNLPWSSAGSNVNSLCHLRKEWIPNQMWSYAYSKKHNALNVG